MGRVVSVNVSPGGVPKRDVGAAFVGAAGVDGDAHNARGHGGPDAAVCIYSIEAIGRVAADGHKAFAGAFGENLTLEGIELGDLAPGDRLVFGEAGPLVELTKMTAPCKTIGDFFREGDFSRISPDTRPEDARWYGRVIREGRVAVGDGVEVTGRPGAAEPA